MCQLCWQNRKQIILYNIKHFYFIPTGLPSVMWPSCFVTQLLANNQSKVLINVWLKISLSLSLMHLLKSEISITNFWTLKICREFLILVFQNIVIHAKMHYSFEKLYNGPIVQFLGGIVSLIAKDIFQFRASYFRMWTAFF